MPESFICPSCGDTGIEPVMVLDSCQVVRCKTCRLEALFPKPDDVEYEKDYYDVWGGEELEAETSVLKQKTSELLLDFLDLPRGATLLEVGCAKGDFVASACRRGYNVVGIDVNKYAIERAVRKGCSAEFIACDIEEVVRRNRIFDAIVMVDVFEHLAEPNDALLSLNTLLRQGGLLLIVTPNAGGFGRKVLGRSWPHYKKEHLFYYTKNNLICMVERSGFQYVRSAPMKKVLSLRYIGGIIRHYSKKTALRHLWTPLRLLEGTSLNTRPFRIRDGTIVLIAKKSGRATPD